jgi:hypothetical protein
MKKEYFPMNSVKKEYFPMNNVKKEYFPMNSVRKSLVVVAVAALSVSMAALPPIASARGLGGFGGHADNASQQTSFSEFWNAVVYNGPGSARWDIPLLIDPVGSDSTTVYAFVNGASSNVSCSAQAVSQDTRFISNTAWYSPNIGNAWTSVTLPAVTTVFNGSLELACFIGNGSRIQTVTW